METPLISICIPTFNGEKFLAPCLDSAIGQTYKNIEIIIVDDKSNDNTFQIEKSYAEKDSRIKLLRNEKNLGLVGNWNKCLELANGSWIKFLFQDDYLDISAIEQMMEGASITDMLIVLKRTYILNEEIEKEVRNYYLNGVKTFERLGIQSNAPVLIGPEIISSIAAKNICLNFIGEPTVVMFQKNLISEIGLFNSDLVQLCDLEYFLRIATKYGIKYIPKPLAYFRIHGGSASSHNISTHSFVMKHLETVITTHQFLYNARFSKFRSYLSFFSKIKLRLFFLIHVYEANKASSEDNSVKFEEICKKYPDIENNKHGSVLIRLIFLLVLLKRKIRLKS